MTATHAELQRILDGSHFNPHSILGNHRTDSTVTIRALKPDARSVTVVTTQARYPMTQDIPGLWSTTIPASDQATLMPYTFEVRYGDTLVTSHDPYCFLPTLGELDLHLIGEGRHEELWKVLGARPISQTIGGIDIHGVRFTVWAPNAQGVRVVGDFNFWNGHAHPMRSLGGSGVWELFIPGLAVGQAYKFALLDQHGQWHIKADPMASATEVPPKTASVIYESHFEWSDAEWLRDRSAGDPHSQPLSIYEVHLGSWRPGLSYQQLAHELVDYVLSSGFTHVEFLPVAEHPYGPSWGYQVTSYYAPTARFGSPDDFRYLINELHRAGIGAILDWVPAHFPKDMWALAQFDGTPLYEHADPRRGEHPDWGTYIFDFGRKEVRNFLVANAVFWLEEFHLDGLRVDAVASMLYLDYSREGSDWLPNQYGGRENLDAVAFLQEMNATVYKRVPGVITIAEESTAWPGVTRPTDLGGLGFGFKWNMGWMHDSLGYVQHESIHRKYHHDEMTFSLMYSFSENFILPFSHDEVVHGKGSLVSRMPGDRWQALANLRTYVAFMWAHPGKKLLFMGSEFAQSDEWSSEKGLDWHLLQFAEHQGVLATVNDLNRIYREFPALWERDNDPRGFEWLDGNASDTNIFSWLRWADNGECMAFIANFSPLVHHDYPLALPFAGRWDEVLNTDSLHYGGSGVGNQGHINAMATEWSGKPAMARITVPPLSAMFFRPPAS
ncbi:MAG: 1,4-alpha-glucan branching protein GlgB [Candidatus Nanopelagicales bacterium]|nr:1,4-alpha-glucan branching protein GlgB [Candidatus Nanopelagicales bacterium]